MKQLFVKQNHTDKLNLIFLGYGQDGAIFEQLKDSDCADIALVYDYENEDFDSSVYRKYKDINLIAWSMGVMMAPKVLDKNGLLDKVTSSSAINGTLEGISDEYGIYRRMCFDAKLYEEYLKFRPKRSEESLKSELIFIREFSNNPTVEGFFYNKAFIGLKDKIISHVNQLNSFKKTNTVTQEVECAHYSYELFKNQLV